MLRVLHGITAFLAVAFMGHWIAARAGTGASTKAIDPISITLPAELELVPQHLLSLVHTPEVWKELSLTNEQQTEFQEFLPTIDGSWWVSRNYPVQKRRTVVEAAEKAAIDFIAKHWNRSQLTRLRQLEWQSQGMRSMLRSEVAKYLDLTKDQSDQLTELFRAVEDARTEAYPKSGKINAAAAERMQKLQSEEPQKAFELLTSTQQKRLDTLVGKRIDLESLKRVYPMAPELIPSPNWVGKPVSLQELRGKVVLLHFYAYQCGNCKNNFPIYNRWHEKLSAKGVQVIGIQSPETAAERVATNVQKAAERDGFKYPVLIDLEMENWNAWANTMWPTVYVIDQDGFIRNWCQAELQWDGAKNDEKIEKLVEELLADSSSSNGK